MIALLAVAAITFALFVAYCRGHEHGQMDCERKLRLVASRPAPVRPAPPEPVRLPPGAGYRATVVPFREHTIEELRAINPALFDGPLQ